LLFDGLQYLEVFRFKFTKHSHSNINSRHNQTTITKEHLRSLPNLSFQECKTVKFVILTLMNFFDLTEFLCFLYKVYLDKFILVADGHIKW
jgi:hypothetical protein